MFLKIFFVIYFLLTHVLVTTFFLIMPRFGKNFANHPYLQVIYIHFAFYLVNAVILFFVFGITGIYCHVINLFLLGAGVIFSRRLRIIGLTGQACSGKSTTAKYLRDKYGASLIIIDDINKEVLSRPEVKKEIREKLGQEVFFENGELNKPKMREMIYKDEKKKKDLETITHMRVLKTMVWAIFREKFLMGNKYVVLENAILLRFKMLTYWCFPILSICLRNQSDLLIRIMKRDNCTQESAENMLKNQTSTEEFYKKSDYCILNDGSEQDLNNEIDKFVNLLNS